MFNIIYDLLYVFILTQRRNRGSGWSETFSKEKAIKLRTGVWRNQSGTEVGEGIQGREKTVGSPEDSK